MAYNIKLIILSVLLPFCTWSQTKEDSLKHVFSKSQKLESRVSSALELIKIYNRTKPDSNLKYLKIVDSLTFNSVDQNLRADYLLAWGNYLQNTGNYRGSIKNIHDAIEIFEKLKNTKGLAKSYNSLGLAYKKVSGDSNEVLEFTEKALMYENKALSYYLQNDDYEGLLRVYSNIGIILRDKKDYKGAEKSYLKGIGEAKRLKYTGYSLGILKANLSQIYLDHYKNYDSAIALLNEAINIYQKNNIITSMEHAYRNISYNYTGKKDYKKAIFYANKAIEIATEVKDPHRQIMAYSSLHHAQKMAGMYKESLENLDIANNIEDSLFSLEKSTIIAELNTRFETVQKDAEIQSLSDKNKINALQIWALLATLVSVVIFVITILQKRKKDKIISQKEKALEKSKLEKAEQELDGKKKELTAKVLQLAHKNEFLNNLESEVNLLKTNIDSNVNLASNKISRMIRRDIDSDKQWDQFSEEFSSIHKGFLHRLVEKHGVFTKTEIRLISLLKMNMSSKEIADIMGISGDGVKKARYRLRKKMNIEDSGLQGYLLSF